MSFYLIALRVLRLRCASSLPVLLIVCLSACAGQAARATEAMAQKEGRACQYCHTSGSPGMIIIDRDGKSHREPLDVNSRGQYYARHNHSFADYVEPVVKAEVPQLFRFIERFTIPDNTRRVAVADVMGDNKPRLICLNEKPDAKDQSVLTVQRWNGKAFVTEFRADTPGAPDKLAVGKFTSDGKAVILTSGAAWHWNGKTFVSKAAVQTANLIGSLRYRADGSERVLTVTNKGELFEHRVNIGPSGSYLMDGARLAELPAAQVSLMDMHNTPAGFEKMQLPAQLTAGGVMGLWTTPKSGRLLLYHVDLDQDIDVKNPNNPTEKAQFTVKSQGWKVGVIDPRAPSLATQFFTPRLLGEVYEVATESPYGDGAPGLLILTSGTPEKKGRSLYFFAYNTASTTLPASN
jgi:hypothetical protein